MICFTSFSYRARTPPPISAAFDPLASPKARRTKAHAVTKHVAEIRIFPVSLQHGRPALFWEASKNKAMGSGCLLGDNLERGREETEQWNRQQFASCGVTAVTCCTSQYNTIQFNTLTVCESQIAKYSPLTLIHNCSQSIFLNASCKHA